MSIFIKQFFQRLQHRPYTVVPNGDNGDEDTIESQDQDINASGSSENSALFHVICVIAGTGILQLPHALAKSGWIGIALMVLSAFGNEYTGRLLIQCLYVDGYLF